MSHTYAQNVIHVVFSTKERRKTIPVEFQPKMWAYSAGICKKQGIFVHAIGGMEDHVHFLIQVPPTMALAKAVLAIKSNSSRWANAGGHKLAWQQGYAAFLLAFPAHTGWANVCRAHSAYSVQDGLRVHTVSDVERSDPTPFPHAQSASRVAESIADPSGPTFRPGRKGSRRAVQVAQALLPVRFSVAQGKPVPTRSG